MQAELDKQLVADFPRIFKHRHDTIQESCMAWGFDCADGWHTLICTFCVQAQHYIDQSRKDRARALRFNRAVTKALLGSDASGLYTYFRYGKEVTPWVEKQVQEVLHKPELRPVPEACPQVVALQVKEKFGTLSFYYSGGDQYIAGMATLMEALSGHTCEKCGQPGQIRNGGWIRTLCDGCQGGN